MKSQQLIPRTERVDDIPLLLAQMRKIDLAKIIDEPFPGHGNWQGLSLGPVISGWLSYILSEGDHGLNHVETWADRLLITLSAGLEGEVKALDLSDDRLARVLDYLSQDESWANVERCLNGNTLRVYNLKTERVRIDTTTAKSYLHVTEEGLFQLGHSKDHRPDLPPLKISQSALDPLGLPITTTVVNGNCADDPLYIPEIKRVQSHLKASGLLHIGDSKMASLETRAYVASSGDYYLCPLSARQIPPAVLEQLLEPVWCEEQTLSTVYRPQTEEETAQQQEPEALVEGFVYEEPMCVNVANETLDWQEQRLVVRSFKHAERQQKALEVRLDKAQTAIVQLNQRGRGRKVREAHELKEAVEKILAKYQVEGLLTVNYHTETQTVQKRAYKDRLARVEETRQTTVYSTLNSLAYQNAVRYLGWRVYVSNDPTLGLNEAVLAYREEYLIERDFGRYKGQVLGLTPLFLSHEDRIKGLVRLLSIGLRILGLLEFSVRQTLHEKDERLAGIYRGHPKRATAKPTAEMMLKAFEWINLTVMVIDDKKLCVLSPLSAVQERILSLLGFTTTIYLALSG